MEQYFDMAEAAEKLIVAEVTLLLMNILPVFKVFRKTIHSLASSHDDEMV